MCKYCGNKPLRLLVQPLNDMREVHAIRQMLDALNKRIEEEVVRETQGQPILTPAGLLLEGAYNHIVAVADLRVGDYSDARKEIAKIRSMT